MRNAAMRAVILAGAAALIPGGTVRAMPRHGIMPVEIGRAAQPPDGVHFSGVIDDHTIATAGSWEIHGEWSLDLLGTSGKANFSAALNMERSDYWLLTSTGANPNSVAARNPHTHHIVVNGGTVTSIPDGFRVTGAALVTGNGSAAPFGTSSTVQVDVTGGDLVSPSNIKLTFGGDAVAHFGSQAFSGVVVRAQ
ncbi:MAG TPA: hypothetical protein VN085_04630 [Vicinamibacterales bacterium]|nr:hypothetical protein [Vicinamibacterales bacterium]